MPPIKAPSLALAAALILAGCTTAGPSGSGTSTAAPAAGPAKHVKANPTIGGATTYPDKTIVENASAAPNLTTLMRAMRAAGLADRLSGSGPYTLFAPTNEAFGRLAPGTVDTLLKPENKPSLVKLLTYHIVAGKITSADIKAKIKAGGGSATLTSLEGDPLTATLTNGIVTLTDVNGNKSYVQTSDVIQSNGVIQVVNGVLVPDLG